MSSRISSIYITHTDNKGRGVFTASQIEKNNFIEACPAVILPAKDRALIHQTKLHDYYFYWGTKGDCAIALGFGSLYNHSSKPNADYRMDVENMSIDIYSIKTILPGEEITINYAKGGDQKTDLWFDEK